MDIAPARTFGIAEQVFPIQFTTILFCSYSES